MTHREAEGGFTLPEVAVTMFIFSIVSVIILSFLDHSSAITNRASSNVVAEKDAQLALRTMTEEIRGANPIVGTCGTGYATCLRFAVKRPTQANPSCTSTFTYRLADGAVTSDRSDAGGCASPRSWTNRTVVGVVNDPAVDPLFRYYDKLGTLISPTAICTTSSSCPQTAWSIGINLRVKYRGQTSSPLTLSSVAALRNSR